MARFGLRFWATSLTLLSIGVFIAISPSCPNAHGQQPSSSTKSSWTNSITSPFKQGFDKVGKAFSPKPSSAPLGTDDDPVSLKSQAKLGPELYVAVARLYEQAGKYGEAEQQYRLALNLSQYDLHAMLGLARLKDAAGKSEEAIQIYQRAASMHPLQSCVHNNLGLCYVRLNRLDEAVIAMNNAIKVEPKNPLYRNNIAAVLIDQGKEREALAQLQAVHSTAAAHYNMGYLLNRKGQTQAAIQQFNSALGADPSMVQARRWVDYLQQRANTMARLPQHPMAAGVRITTEQPQHPVATGVGTTTEQPTPVDSSLPTPPEPVPQRLPPTTVAPTPPKTQTLPGISYDPPPTAPTAPLPPTLIRSSGRPVQRTYY